VVVVVVTAVKVKCTSGAPKPEHQLVAGGLACVWQVQGETCLFYNLVATMGKLDMLCMELYWGAGC